MPIEILADRRRSRCRDQRCRSGPPARRRHVRRDRARVRRAWCHLLPRPAHHAARNRWISPAASARSNSTSSASDGACRAVRRSSSSPISPRTDGPSASAAPARTGIATCATPPVRRAGRCCTRWKFPTCIGLALGRYRIRQRRCGMGRVARADPAPHRRSAGGVRLHRPQAGLPADPGRDRSQSAGPPSDRSDASVYRAQVPVRHARRLHRYRWVWSRQKPRR